MAWTRLSWGEGLPFLPIFAAAVSSHRGNCNGTADFSKTCGGKPTSAKYLLHPWRLLSGVTLTQTTY